MVDKQMEKKMGLNSDRLLVEVKLDIQNYQRNLYFSMIKEV